VGYLGVMGSRRTHERRLVRLAAHGITDPADLARLRSPIGLDLGARTPEETAVAICAEIIAQRTGVRAPSLKDADGPIHRV
jgi:xanthine dehydrogenase accessory factor